MCVEKRDPFVSHLLQMRRLNSAVWIGWGDITNSKVVGEDKDDVGSLVGPSVLSCGDACDERQSQKVRTWLKLKHLEGSKAMQFKNLTRQCLILFELTLGNAAALAQKT